jgi:hypothetical protein
MIETTKDNASNCVPIPFRNNTGYLFQGWALLLFESIPLETIHSKMSTGIIILERESQ